jgi:hypothetical protein
MSDNFILFLVIFFLGISWPEISDFDLFKEFLNEKKDPKLANFGEKKKKKKKEKNI